MKIYDSDTKKYLNGYQLYRTITLFGRTFNFVYKGENLKDSKQRLEICFYFNGINILLNESLTYIDSDYHYFYIFMLAYINVDELYVADPGDPSFYADYVVDVFNMIDETFETGYKPVPYDVLLGMFKEELNKSGLI